MLLILKPPKKLPQAATNFLTFTQAGISIADINLADRLADQNDKGRNLPENSARSNSGQYPAKATPDGKS